MTTSAGFASRAQVMGWCLRLSHDEVDSVSLPVIPQDEDWENYSGFNDRLTIMSVCSIVIGLLQRPGTIPAAM